MKYIFLYYIFVYIFNLGGFWKGAGHGMTEIKSGGWHTYHHPIVTALPIDEPSIADPPPAVPAPPAAVTEEAAAVEEAAAEAAPRRRRRQRRCRQRRRRRRPRAAAESPRAAAAVPRIKYLLFELVCPAAAAIQQLSKASPPARCLQKISYLDKQ